MAASDIGSIYTPAIFGRTSFPLRHKGEPIFHKIFNGSSEFTIDLGKDEISIKDHFFKTGEKLSYSPGSGTSIGIDANSPGNVGLVTYLPSEVYPIVVDKDTIKLAFTSQLAAVGSNIDLNNLGISTDHSFTAEKQNSKCLINVDALVQAPVSVSSTIGITSFTNISLTVDSLNNLRIGTLLRVSDGSSQEIVKISAIDYSSKILSVSRGLEIMGTPQIIFSGIITQTAAEVLSGTYNIVKDKIYFVEPPLEGKKLNLNIEIEDIDFEQNSFTYFDVDGVLTTGAEAVFYSENPPQELENGRKYYLIKAANNTYKLAIDILEAVNGTEVQFSSFSGNEFPVENFQFFLLLPSENSSFDGRVFLKSNYDGNYVFDDISEQFTGITSSFELKVGGASTVGIKSDTGIVLINNVFQYPESTESYSYQESGSQTFVEFVGSGSTKDYDVNVGGLPRGGTIISYGSTGGSLYAPLLPARGVAVVSAGGTIGDVLIADEGSGYRSGITTYYVRFYNQELPGSGGLAVAYPNSSGIITGVTVIDGGSGYEYNGESDILETAISSSDPDGTPIDVVDPTQFANFRGYPVNSTTNPGFVKIGDEIIRYTSVGANSLLGTYRAQFGTATPDHLLGATVLKYEYNYFAKFDDPYPYEDVSLTGSSTGIGASVSFAIDQYGNVSKLKFNNYGYNYSVGEVLIPDNVLGISTQTNAEKLHITINEVAKDTFNAWNIGTLRKLNDLTPYVNGVRKTFTLYEEIETDVGSIVRRTSLEADPASEIDLDQNLLIFVNDILQKPGESYTFEGGSLLEFSEPPPLGSKVKVYFYEGFTGDNLFNLSELDIKEGDKLKIQKYEFANLPTEQLTRTVQKIMSSDTLRTEIYLNKGISESSSQNRSISWTPQLSDAIINGEYVFKSREERETTIPRFSPLYVNNIVNPGIQTVAITTTSGTFAGLNTNFISVDTTSGIGSIVATGDYIESEYIGAGVTITYVGSGIIGIATPFLPYALGGGYAGTESYCSSPDGTNVVPISFYRRGDFDFDEWLISLGVVSYTVSVASTSINEGSVLTFNVDTTSVSDGDILYWAIDNGTTVNSDFASTSGNFTINSNFGTFTVTPSADFTTEGSETFGVSIYTDSALSVGVATTSGIVINDTSLTATYSMSPTVGIVTEGGSLGITVTTTNIPNGTSLFWRAVGAFPSVNIASNNDFVFYEGSVLINTNAGSFTVQPVQDFITEPPEDFRIELHTNSAYTNLVSQTGTFTIF